MLCQDPGQLANIYGADAVNRGYYEVIGTLQANQTISQMTSTYMGDNLGALPTHHLVPTAPDLSCDHRRAPTPRPTSSALTLIPPQTWRCTATW